jgi:hypothetical protein
VSLLLHLGAVCAALLAIFGLLALFTRSARHAWSWVRDKALRRPSAPRTRVIIQPREPNCHWSQGPSPAKPPDDGNHVMFTFDAVVTNLTPS